MDRRTKVELVGEKGSLIAFCDGGPTVTIQGGLAGFQRTVRLLSGDGQTEVYAGKLESGTAVTVPGMSGKYIFMLH